MALFKKTQKTSKYSDATKIYATVHEGDTFEAHYNTANHIEVCKVDKATGLGLTLVALFADSFDMNIWLRENKKIFPVNPVTWGTENENATREYERKYAL